jgi:hypothetical protein
MGEASIEMLGIVRRDVRDPDPGIRRVERLDGFDAVMTDDPSSTIADEALEAGVPCVLWAGAPDLPDGGAEGIFLTGANLVDGIGRSLLARESVRSGRSARLRFAWTEPGKPLGRGEAVTFPDPVGARRGTLRRSTETLVEVVVPVPDEWAGIVVDTIRGDRTRTVGIADLAVHLEAIALAAGAVIAAGGLLPDGTTRPEEFADPYLAASFRIGLDAASFVAAG